ncbi:hypothetical protein BUALT_Bualt11G0104100 [Buddleja alternifolia]|uniref:Sulfite exporter TauE/SafE family protein n=1 Tax=Buddleja alternifolia TaxID=168488 RepID=A0AAV6X204_9LAMI|nr:hypothetical protein BUALT_Bualt11G0104100 [Buddleja alternifolia]
MTAIKGLVLYLLTGFSFALLSVFFINNYSYSSNSSILQHKYGSEVKVWPELKFSWRVVLATVIGFLGSACGTVGGVGGGGIFVPMLTLVVGFDTKSAAAISKCMIMGASGSSVWYNLRVPHPCREVPIIDYDLALFFQPMLMLGITIGVSLSVIFPYWLITVLIIILFLGTSSRSFAKAIEMWKGETMLKKAIDEKQRVADSNRELLIDADYEALVPKEEKTTLNDAKFCSTLYWMLNLLQLPVALVVFLYECVKLYKESKKRRMSGNHELICEASVEWTGTNLAFCAICGLLGGIVGGLLGSGGGFILGPLLLEIGVIPQDKYEDDLPWERGDYNESNTLLVDDSPYKALCYPQCTAIFYYTYRFTDVRVNSLGTGGDLRVYLEGLAMAENVKEYVKQNPSGQRPITEKNLK